MSTKKTFLILFAIVVLGFSLRAYKLGEPDFVTDEFLDINATYGYFKTGEWKAWDFNLERVSDNLYAPRDERAWMYRIQVAQLFRFLPSTEAVARSVSVFWGVVNIIGLYFAGKYFTGKKEIGLIAAFLFAVSPLGILIDRTFRMYAMFQPLFLLFSWFLFRFFDEEYVGSWEVLKKISRVTGLNFVWFIPMLVVGALSFNVQDLTASVVVALGLYVVIMAVRAVVKSGFSFNKYVATIATLLFGLAGLFVFFPIKAAWYLNETLKFFKFEFKYIVAAVGDYNNFTLAYMLIFFGTYALFKRSDNFKGAAWVACLFYGILASAFLVWKYVFGERLIFFVLSFGIILLASGIYYAVKMVAANFTKYQQQIFVGLLAFILLALPNYSSLIGQNSVYSPEEAGYRKTFNYIVENGAAGDVLLTRNFRSYYYAGAHFRAIDVGNGKRLTLDQLRELMAESPRIWGVFGDGKGSFTKESLVVVKSEFSVVQRIGDNEIYLWEK